MTSAMLVAVLVASGGLALAAAPRVPPGRVRPGGAARLGRPAAGWRPGQPGDGAAPPSETRGRRRWVRRRSVTGDDVPVARVCERLAALLGAGLPAAAAWEHVAAVTGAWTASRRDAAVVDAVTAAAAVARRGDPVAAALRQGAASCRDRGDAAALRALAATWAVAEVSGAPTGATLGHLAGRLRQDAAARDAQQVALAAPRATARLLAGLPAAGLGLGWAIGADPFGVLTGTAVGAASGLAGGALAVAGWLWSRRLVAAAREAGT